MPILRLNLNVKFQPADRADFEDALQEKMTEAELGQVVGGGTLLAKSGEVENCDIEIEVEDYSGAEEIRELAEAFGAPRGSKLFLEEDDREIPLGQAEGLGVYLNGTDLPDEVYEQCDVNFVYSEFQRLLEGAGAIWSHWQGPSETALYLYGRSAAEMRERIQDFMDSYRLCEKARVVQIA